MRLPCSRSQAPAKEAVQKRCIYFIFISTILPLEENILFSEQPPARGPDYMGHGNILKMQCFCKKNS
jgi:hypothetical protein